MLIPISPLTKYLTTSLIAPHGITDLVHAKETNHTMQLLTTYSLTNGGVLGLHYMHYDNAVNILEKWMENKKKPFNFERLF